MAGRPNWARLNSEKRVIKHGHIDKDNESPTAPTDSDIFSTNPPNFQITEHNVSLEARTCFVGGLLYVIIHFRSYKDYFAIARILDLYPQSDVRNKAGHSIAFSIGLKCDMRKSSGKSLSPDKQRNIWNQFDDSKFALLEEKLLKIFGVAGASVQIAKLPKEFNFK